MSQQLQIAFLAEEIILKILSYLAVEDLINISLTCNAFNRLACDKELVRSLSFSKAYTCTLEDLKTFLIPRTRCLHISKLDLTNCYWIRAPSLIVKLKNLESLQMNAVPLTFLQLDSILKACPKIQDLSVSWPEEAMPIPLSKWEEKISGLEEGDSILKNLVSIRAQVNFNFSHFMVFLKPCCILQRLIITSHHSREFCFTSGDRLFNQAKWSVGLPRLQEFVLDQENVMLPLPYLGGILSKTIQEQETNPLQWKTCWINNRYPAASMRLINDKIFARCSRLFLGLTFETLDTVRSLGELGSLTELMVVGAATTNTNLTSIVNACPNLRSLNVFLGLNVSLDITKVYEKLPDLERLSLHCQPLQGPPKISTGVAQFCKLTHLSVPVCALIEMRDREVSEVVQDTDYMNCLNFKRRRMGAKESGDVELAAFNDVFENCPKIVMLQIGFNQEISCSPLRIQWECLTNVKKLTHLTSLTLDSIPISNGQFLVEIAKGCSNLEFLRLRRLGLSGKCVYTVHLAEALPYCKSLKHCRIEQNYLAPATGIFQALKQCRKLERVAVLSERDMTALNLDAIEYLIQARTNLIFLFVIGGHTTKEKCAKLTKKYRNLESRPALIVRVKNNLKDVFDDKNQDIHSTPACHFNEMITFRSWMYDFYDAD